VSIIILKITISWVKGAFSDSLLEQSPDNNQSNKRRK